MPVTQEVTGSSPVVPAKNSRADTRGARLTQLGLDERLGDLASSQNSMPNSISYMWLLYDLAETSRDRSCGCVSSLAFVDDFKRIPVRVKYICSVVSGIVFHSYPWGNIVSGTGGNCRPVEFIDPFIVFGHEPPVNGRWIGLPLLEPEERPLAITKSP